MKNRPKFIWSKWIRYLLILLPIISSVFANRIRKKVNNTKKKVVVLSKVSKKEDIIFIVNKDFMFRSCAIPKHTTLHMSFTNDLVTISCSSGKIFEIDPNKIHRDDATKYLEFVDISTK